MSKVLRRGLLCCLLVLLAALASLAPYLGDSAELVRMRNALLIDFDHIDSTRFDWTPDTTPADFQLERAAPDPQFLARVQALHLERLPDDWQRALAIARHLLSKHPGHFGKPIQADLEKTYQDIVNKGDGYCGDYVPAYAALALAGGLQSRQWAFSFEGFGGLGHVFNEVWNAQSGRWLMLDVFNNFYPLGEDGQPMSALEFHERMRQGRLAQVRFVPIEPRALAGPLDEAFLHRYFQRGASQWYLWWSSAVYTYDRAWLVRLLGPVSRSLEQLGGIVQGVHPRIRVLPEDANAAQRQAMWRLRVHLLVVLALGVLSSLVAVVLLLLHWGRRRPAHRALFA